MGGGIPRAQRSVGVVFCVATRGAKDHRMTAPKQTIVPYPNFCDSDALRASKVASKF